MSEALSILIPRISVFSFFFLLLTVLKQHNIACNNSVFQTFLPYMKSFMDDKNIYRCSLTAKIRTLTKRLFFSFFLSSFLNIC